MREVRLLELDAIAARLVVQLDSDGFRPAAVVYVERAGWFIGDRVAQALAVPLVAVRTQRAGASVKRWLAPLARRLPAQLRKLATWAELRSGVHGRGQRQVSSGEELRGMRGHPVLVVDDAVDSGRTLICVVDHLLHAGWERSMIRSAAITVTSARPLMRPDVAVFDEICSFPWSTGSPESDTAWSRYHSAVGERTD